MRILFISPYIIEEDSLGGMKRLVKFLNFLSKKHSVFVTCLNLRTQYKTPIKLSIAENVFIFKRPIYSTFRRIYNQIMSFTPSYVINCYSQDMSKSIVNLVEKYDIELVHFEFFYVGEYIHSIKRKECVKVLVEQELNFKRVLKDIKVSKISIKLPWLFINYLKQRRYEVNIWKEFDKLFTVSNEEKNVIKSYCNDLDVEVYPNVVDIEYFNPALVNMDEEQFSMVFVGDYGHNPNEVGILWFCKYILPLVSRKIPNLRLYIVGANPTKRVIGLREEKIIVTGFVEDIRPFLKKSTVFINPIITGGGMRGKVLEAMAFRKPVISTSLGAEGIKTIGGENIIIVDSPEEFSKNLVELLRNKDLRRKIGENGKALVVKEYDEMVIFQKMEKIYESLIKEKRKEG